MLPSYGGLAFLPDAYDSVCRVCLRGCVRACVRASACCVAVRACCLRGCVAYCLRSAGRQESVRARSAREGAGGAGAGGPGLQSPQVEQPHLASGAHADGDDQPGNGRDGGAGPGGAWRSVFAIGGVCCDVACGVAHARAILAWGIRPSATAAAAAAAAATIKTKQQQQQQQQLRASAVHRVPGQLLRARGVRCDDRRGAFRNNPTRWQFDPVVQEEGDVRATRVDPGREKSPKARFEYYGIIFWCRSFFMIYVSCD